MEKNEVYSVVLSKKAEKQLDKLPDSIAQPILEAIFNLEENPRPHGYIKLKGEEYYRIRVRNFRIIYDIQDNILVVNIISIGDRKEVYK